MWMKIDDGLHAHRKTRAITKSHDTKHRDAAAMGLWVLSGSWAAQNGTDGWVPEDELERWDDDWSDLAERLVRTGWWKAQKRNGEPGYGFKDWHDYNDPADLASKSGTYGNHVRWHVNEGRVEPECEHCPKEPDRPDIAPESPPDSDPTSPPESRFGSPPIALPDPNPTRPEPGPTTLSDTSDLILDRFDEFWDAYSNKVGRRSAELKWRLAIKKRGVTQDLLIAAAGQYAAWCRQTGTYQKHPTTWLNGEHWLDERPTGLVTTTSRKQQETDGIFERALARAQEDQ